MVPQMEGSASWTFALVEEAMVEAWGYLRRMPDAERAWLKSCERSAMPVPVRDARAGDWIDTVQGRRGLMAREVDLVDRVFLGEGAWIEWVMPRDKVLVAAVMQVMTANRGGGFGWSDVAGVMGWVAGPNALRMRYDRAVARVAGRLNDNKVPVA